MERYFARVKPCSPKRGHHVRRFHCLGRLWRGGDGITPGDIPEWVEVNAAQAEMLKTFRQHNRDAYAPEVFDIVTLEQKAAIDQKEENFRKAVFGIQGATNITELPNVEAKERQALTTPQGRITLADLKDAKPSRPVVTDVNEIGTPEMPPTVKTGDAVKARTINASGRAEAASDFEETEDMNADADTESVEAAPVPPARSRRAPHKAAPAFSPKDDEND